MACLVSTCTLKFTIWKALQIPRLFSWANVLQDFPRRILHTEHSPYIRLFNLMSLKRTGVPKRLASYTHPHLSFVFL